MNRGWRHCLVGLSRRLDTISSLCSVSIKYSMKAHNGRCPNGNPQLEVSVASLVVPQTLIRKNWALTKCVEVLELCLCCQSFATHLRLYEKFVREALTQNAVTIITYNQCLSRCWTQVLPGFFIKVERIFNMIWISGIPVPVQETQ
jgi:hypothetical protein